LYLATPLHRLVEPVASLALRLVLLSRFQTWCDQNPLPSVTTSGSSEHRYERRYQLYRFVLDAGNLGRAPIDYLEFGVASGASLEWWLRNHTHPESSFVGFDTFRGLPEDWHSRAPRGAFSTDGRVPELQDTRCRFEVGMFQDTLPHFLRRSVFQHRLVVHMDADLYSSTLYVLMALAPVLKPGDLILFDQFDDVRNEFRAFQDFITASPLRYEVVAQVNGYRQLCLRVA
jgi:hypothetical protein